MQKYLYISLCLIVLAVSCDKENVSEIQADSFIKFFNNYSVFTAADVKQVNGSGYAILGTSMTNDDGTQICLLRTNKFGNTIDPPRFFGRALDDQAYCLKVMDDGGFAILGSSRNPATEKLEVYFIRIDSNGDIQWERTIASSGNIEAKHFEMDSHGSFFMTGYYEQGSTVIDKQIWIFALKEDGSDLWPNPRIYGGAKDDEGSYLQVLQNGYLVITGHTKSYPSGTLVDHAFILRTDENGGLDVFFQMTSLTDEEGSCIKALDNDNVLVLGTIKGTAGSDISLKYVSLATLHVEWEKTYGSTGNDFGCSMLTDDTSIYLLSTTGTTETNTAISLITTNELGDQTARSDFGLGSRLSGSSFGRTADGGFIITGTNELSDNSKSVALIKTGADTSL